MNVDQFFRISVINAGLAVVRHQHVYPDSSTLEAIRQLKAGPSYVASFDYDAAQTLGEGWGWEVFAVDANRRQELQATLLKMSLACRPFWSQVSTYGRERVKQILNEDQLQCLGFAGLLDSPPSSDVVEWWDALSQDFRDETSNRALEIGREGELLSLQYERNRLKALGVSDREPKWMSIEDNTAGFDIVSFDMYVNNQVYDIRIEVKASYSTPCTFFLTRNEWEVAVRNPSSYRFHLWDLSSGQLYIYGASQAAAHVPHDQGEGRWTKAELPYSITAKV